MAITGKIAHELGDSLTGTAQIVFFLMGAMTIVEVVDAHNGFEVITQRIRTQSLSRLLWLVGIVAFFLSALLDNLTTTIVMVSLMRKLLARHEDRLFFAGIIVIAANAGGAWTPIGDVTTTMLWIGGQISSLATMRDLFLASAVALLVPLAITALTCCAAVRSSGAEHIDMDHGLKTTELERNPCSARPRHPDRGAGVQDHHAACRPSWASCSARHPLAGGRPDPPPQGGPAKQHLTLAHALSRIDMSSLVFFVGILLAVATLEHTHILSSLARWLDQNIGRLDLIVILIGMFSAVVDNVPLVAASMGMYDLKRVPDRPLPVGGLPSGWPGPAVRRADPRHRPAGHPLCPLLPVRRDSLGGFTPICCCSWAPCWAWCCRKT
jgi:Na+/H+ antiporter NhaD/arsenite permease-like protein